MALSYLAKPLGERIAAWQKVVFGCSLILLCVILITGPLVLFSNLVDAFLLGNPVSKIELTLSLGIKKQEDSIVTPYKLLELTNTFKL